MKIYLGIIELKHENYFNKKTDVTFEIQEVECIEKNKTYRLDSNSSYKTILRKEGK